MKLRTLIGTGTLAGILCAGGSLVKREQEPPSPSMNPSRGQTKERGDSSLSLIRRSLSGLLKSDSLNHDDPCLEVAQAVWDTFKAGTGPEAESHARGELYDCQETLTAEQLRVSLSNFHILKSQTSYEMICGDKGEEKCRELQDKVKKEMDKLALGEWTYNDWAWSYDENGEIVDVAAFPSYQAYLPDPEGSHEDLWSIMTYEKDGREVYSFGIACGAKEGLATMNASTAYASPEALARGIQEIRSYHSITY